MAERERLTNKERREQARAERKRREAEAQQARKRGAWRNGLITFVIVAVVAAVVLQAFTGRPDTIDDTILVSATAVEDARDAAGCDYLALEAPLEDRTHVDNPNQINPDVEYTDTRPTHSGPHTGSVHPVTSAASSQIDEVSTTHNLEHGSIIVWWDPDQADSSDVSALGDWAEELNANGFRRSDAGVGIMSSPYEDPGIASGKAYAFRAWGAAMDCDTWDEEVAYAFVLDHFGTNGIAPEQTLAGFPTEVLQYDDGDADDGDTDDGDTDDGDGDTDGADAEEPDQGDDA